jgi:hypothetical protein
LAIEIKSPNKRRTKRIKERSLLVLLLRRIVKKKEKRRKKRKIKIIRNSTLKKRSL